MINAKQLATADCVFLASRDITSSMETVSFLLLTLPSLLISAVPIGNGTTKFAYNALKTGSLTHSEHVYLSVVSVVLGMMVDNVLLAIKAMI